MASQSNIRKDKVMVMKDYYNEIVDSIIQYQKKTLNGTYDRLGYGSNIKDMDSISNKIIWCRKFKHITEYQKDILIEYFTDVLNDEDTNWFNK